jgi:hypothetical protein
LRRRRRRRRRRRIEFDDIEIQGGLHYQEGMMGGCTSLW